MKRIKLLILLTLWIATIQADETPEIIKIEIDILWNSTSGNSSAQALANILEGHSSTDPNANPVTATSADVLNEYGGHIGPPLASTASLEAGSSTNAQISTPPTAGADSFMPTGSSQTGYWGLTGSAPTASQSSGMWQSNNSVWATGSLRPTSSPFSGKASARKSSKDVLGLAVILCCITLSL
ncbi:MAG: hypothetical protein Q9217_000172 [Psora testacea]